MDSTLEVQVKITYGTERIYPINEQAKRVAHLLGKKTFTKEDVAKLKEVGFQFKWVPIELDTTNYKP